MRGQSIPPLAMSDVWASPNSSTSLSPPQRGEIGARPSPIVEHPCRRCAAGPAPLSPPFAAGEKRPRPFFPFNRLPQEFPRPPAPPSTPDFAAFILPGSFSGGSARGTGREASGEPAPASTGPDRGGGAETWAQSPRRRHKLRPPVTRRRGERFRQTNGLTDAGLSPDGGFCSLPARPFSGRDGTADGAPRPGRANPRPPGRATLPTTEGETVGQGPQPVRHGRPRLGAGKSPGIRRRQQPQAKPDGAVARAAVTTHEGSGHGAVSLTAPTARRETGVAALPHACARAFLRGGVHPPSFDRPPFSPRRFTPRT